MFKYIFSSGCSEVNSTWLITSEQTNQHARKVLFTCVTYVLNVFIVGYVTFWVLCDTLSQSFISGESVYILRCLHLYSFESYDRLSKLCQTLKTALNQSLRYFTGAHHHLRNKNLLSAAFQVALSLRSLKKNPKYSSNSKGTKRTKSNSIYCVDFFHFCRYFNVRFVSQWVPRELICLCWWYQQHYQFRRLVHYPGFLAIKILSGAHILSIAVDAIYVSWTVENNWLVPPVQCVLLGWSNTSLYAARLGRCWLHLLPRPLGDICPWVLLGFTHWLWQV